MKLVGKNKKGISLIVLVMTIIVMIVLATAVVITLSNSGIISKANDAVDKTNEAQVKMYAQTIWADAFLDGKRGEELVEVVELGLEELGVTAMDYTIDISDSGMDIQKFDVADWEMAYTYNQATSTWSSKILATDNVTPIGDIVVKLYNLGKEIIPPSFEVNGQSFVFKSGNAYKMLVQGTGDMGALMTTSGSNVTGASAWQLDTALFMQGAETCIIPYVTEVIIDKGVTNIGAYACGGASSLKKVVIANSVQSIDEYAFMFAKSLVNIVIPNDMSYIGANAFSHCSSLTNVIVPDSVTSIGKYAFNSCSGLTSVTIGDSVTSIGDYAFRSCSSLTSVTIGDSVTSIGHVAFGYCSSLTNVIIPDSVTSIGNYAFNSCSSLTSVTIGDSVTSIGHVAFGYCSSLTNVIIPDSVTSIGKYAFNSCSSLTSITIGDGVTSIGEYAFYATELTTVNYTGTAEQWSKISIANYNDKLTNAKINYNYVV